MAKQINHFYEFGSVKLDATNRILFKNGAQLSLQPRVIETLLVLVTNAFTVVDKETLINTVWPDVIVEEGGLKRNISLLRKALGEDGQFIETLPKRGYRFIADVRENWVECPTAGSQYQPADVVVNRRANMRITHQELIEDSADAHTAHYQRQNVTRMLQTRIGVLMCGGLLFALLVGLWIFWNSKPRGAASAAPIRTIAVLPFKNLGPHAGDEQFGIGIADALITRLSTIKDLNVRPTSAVLRFDNDEQDSISAGRALGVEAVLEGSAYRVNDRIRVTARLVRVNDQSPVWAGQFDETADDFLSIHNAIPQAIVTSLSLNLSSGEKDALAKRHTTSSEAYRLYLEGRLQWNKRSSDGMRKAEGLFRNAIEKDPNFALAYVGLADTLSMGRDVLEPVYAIEKAIELDDKLGEAYASRGFYRAMNKWEWQAAEADFKRSIEFSPGYGTAHQWYATLLAINGRIEEAKSQMRQALEIEPASYNFLADMGQMHYFAREYDEAESFCRKSLEIYPDFVNALTYLSNIYFKKGEPEKALEELLKVYRTGIETVTFSNVDTYVTSELAKLRRIYHQSGYTGILRQEIKETPSTPDGSYKYRLFFKHSQLNDKDEALDWLEKSYEQHSFMLPFANVDPIFDSLRSEPRFQAVLRRMGL